MNDMKLLVVEDDDRDLDTFRNTVIRFNHQEGRSVQMVESETLDDAINTLDDSFDGAIVDLKLRRDKDQQYATPGAGNQVIQSIQDKQYRYPIAVITGTPEEAEVQFNYVGTYTKGEFDYDDLLHKFVAIYDTGLTRIMGGRGIIETRLNGIFEFNLIPQITSWERYAQSDSEMTQKSLLRHAMNHLVQIIDEDTEICFPEEFYLHPSPNIKIRTGSIIEYKNHRVRYVVMNPDCDLVERNGVRKTDRILLSQVIEPEDLFDWYERRQFEDLSKSKMARLKRALNNNHTPYLHCLPDTEIQRLGFIDFRRLKSVPYDCISPIIETQEFTQISPPFVKDIVSRFSSYYARQGQPDIDFDDFLST